MKKTMKTAQNKGLKSGLSMMLTLVLLMQVGKPLMAQAESPSKANEISFASLTEYVLNETGSIETTVIEKKPELVQDVLTEVCEARGYGEECAKHLLGMLWKESNNIATAIGDKGKARGYFQIWYKLHKITIECAEDLRCSANWTIDYLESNHYPKYVSYAVQCHNGCNIDNGYAASALRHGRRLWTQPLEVVTAKEIRTEIALK
jgi:hypothetical protein